MAKSASFHFHESLNDFLLLSKRNVSIVYSFNDTPAIKHAIETIGVPHPEVDMILVNGAPVDVLLGKLAKALRLLGFDTCYKNDYVDKTIVQIAEAEKRIVLTRDVNLLKHKSVTVGY